MAVITTLSYAKLSNFANRYWNEYAEISGASQYLRVYTCRPGLSLPTLARKPIRSQKTVKLEYETDQRGNQSIADKDFKNTVFMHMTIAPYHGRTIELHDLSGVEV